MATKNSINNKSGDLTIDPGASGDSFVQLAINAVNKYRIGVDDDDSDKFKIAIGNALGTSDAFIVTANGEITKPLQSAFSAQLSATKSNVTGDGTVYTILFQNEIFDQNSDYDGTSTFTAPVTGRYHFHAAELYSGLTTSHTGTSYIEIETSNRTYRTAVGDYGDLSSATGTRQINLASVTVLADMDASDTAVVKTAVSGSSKVVDLALGGATDPRGGFHGVLIC